VPEAEAAEEEGGIQNQKQEPHTKMWGKITIDGRTENRRKYPTTHVDPAKVPSGFV
jgi:hypothetical protein